MTKLSLFPGVESQQATEDSKSTRLQDLEILELMPDAFEYLLANGKITIWVKLFNLLHVLANKTLSFDNIALILFFDLVEIKIINTHNNIKMTLYCNNCI